MLQGVVKASSIDWSIRVWARARRTDLFASITHDDLNVMFSLGSFSAAWCWRLQGLAGKGGATFLQQLDLGMVIATFITDLSL